MRRLRPRPADTTRIGVVRFAEAGELSAPGPDLAIRAVDAVRLVSSQTIAGVKTFSSFPLLPAGAPSTSTQAAHKFYVDTKAGELQADMVSLTLNQTVNGTKTFGTIPVLPASDPTTTNQATRKAYVDARSSNASNLTTGTVPRSLLPDATLTEKGAVTLQETTLVRSKSSAGPFTPAAWIGAQAWVTVTASTSHAPNLNLGINFELQANNNYTVNNPTNVTAGQTGAFYLVNTTASPITLTFGANYYFDNPEPLPPLEANQKLLIRYYARSSTVIQCYPEGLGGANTLSNYFDTDLIDLLSDPATTQLQFDNYVTANGFATSTFLWVSATNISLVAANTTAMGVLAGDGVSFLPGITASTTAMNSLAASTTAMDILAASTTAMDILAASTTAMDILAASTTAMNSLAASTTAMDILAASTVAMNSLAASTTAMHILAASTTCLTVTFGTLTGRNSFWFNQIASDILLGTPHSRNWMLSNVSTTIAINIVGAVNSTELLSNSGKVFLLQSKFSNANSSYYRFAFRRGGSMSPSYNNTAFVDFNVPLGRSLWTSGDLPYLRNNNIYTRTLTAVFVNMEAF